MATLKTRLKQAMSAFRNNEIPREVNYGGSASYYPLNYPFTTYNDGSMTASIYNKIAVDVSAVHMAHVRVDDAGNFKSRMSSSLNNILMHSANLDQTAEMFIQETVMTMLDHGEVALVPTKIDIAAPEVYNLIKELRCGRIIQWYPKHVQVRVYNIEEGQFKDIIVEKEAVAIVRNPFRRVMNNHNSLLNRLTNKLNLSDRIDETIGNGKLDMIVQVPYSMKTESRKATAEIRRNELEEQLNRSAYGIGYIDTTERIIQLNRPITNQLLEQIQWLTSMLYSQLGITEEILNGTANEQTMVNYYVSTLEPILSAIATEIERKFISATGVTQGQAIRFYRDAFKYMTMSSFAQTADLLTRNEITSSNEMRGKLGMVPVDTEEANQLRNKNLNRKDQVDPYSTEDPYQETTSTETTE